MTFCFAFKWTNALKVAEKFYDNIYSLESSVAAIDYLCSLLLTIKPQKIIGFGDYSWPDNDFFRLETFCTNRFRNEFLDSSGLKKYQLSLIFDQDSRRKLAYGIGNSRCNLVSYKISRLADLNNYRAKYWFVHVPKKMLR